MLCPLEIREEKNSTDNLSDVNVDTLEDIDVPSNNQ